MRSRYSAYALNKPEYLMLTTHPTSPHHKDNRQVWARQIGAFSTGTRFAGLEILAMTADSVTFHAILFEGEKDASYIERSLFAQHDGRWKYIKGSDEA
jgi:SEC-C motif-containing protein